MTLSCQMFVYLYNLTYHIIVMCYLDLVYFVIPENNKYFHVLILQLYQRHIRTNKSGLISLPSDATQVLSLVKLNRGIH